MPAKAYGRTRIRSEDRTTQALDLWLHHRMSYREIGKELGISGSRVGQLVQAALRRAARERSELANAGLEVQLERLEQVVSDTRAVIDATCAKCHGHGKRNGRTCNGCEGTGYGHTVVDRGRAQDRLMRAIELQAKLLGQFAPERHEHMVFDRLAGFRSELAAMPDDELSKALGDFQAGVEAERQRAAALQTKEGQVAPDTA